MLEVIERPAADRGAMPDTELLGEYEETRREIARHEARSAWLLGEIDRRRCYEPYGYLSTVAYVADRTGDSHQVAAGRLRTARALADMPTTAAAFADGDIGTARVRRLIHARETSPDAFIKDEPGLVEKARSLDAQSFTGEVEMWRRSVTRQITADEERKWFERRRLSIRDTFDGMIELDALLDPVSGETIMTAIQSLAGPANRDRLDDRTPTQRRVDALTEICRHHLDSGAAPWVGGQKPHLNVIVDVDTLHEGVRSRTEIGQGRVIGLSTMEFFACDAAVCRLVMDGPARVLDLGRRVRTATPAQLEALAIRDGGCVVPGCGRPPDWCDAHHKLPWVEGGLTDIDEMCLLCRPHHLALHLGLLDLPLLE
ncbi:MAG: DUF222 domain-containing protein [Actinomycetota bacterium]|nr:DUF222 domain-containing protein [Actinomycetota bacterium]